MVRPPTLTYKLSAVLSTRTAQGAHHQLINSLSFFIGSALTVLDAGLALKTHGSFVKGLTPLRAGLAGFCLSFKLSAPAILKEPTFFSCPAATLIKASIVSFTSFCFKPVDSATDLYAADAVMAFAPCAPFIAFIAFMALPMYSA